MAPVNTDMFGATTVDVIEISEDEYNTLSLAIKKNEEIVIEEQLPALEESTEVPVDQNEVITVSYMKDLKVLEMSKECHKAIEAGFDVVYEGKTKHYSLKTEDQISILNLATMMATGETNLPYHADGEIIRFYNPAEADLVIAGANKHRSYHIAYFNSLQAYIKSKTSVTKIADITYGGPIPDRYQSEVLKSFGSKQV